MSLFRNKLTNCHLVYMSTWSSVSQFSQPHTIWSFLENKFQYQNWKIKTRKSIDCINILTPPPPCYTVIKMASALTISLITSVMPETSFHLILKILQLSYRLSNLPQGKCFLSPYFRDCLAISINQVISNVGSFNKAKIKRKCLIKTNSFYPQFLNTKDQHKRWIAIVNTFIICL